MIFNRILFGSAIFIALCAAAFSVTGIAQLFVGAAISTGIMALSLELGKIVGVSFLYRYWNVISRSMKIYLTAAIFSLVVITSVGIYGYLFSAYASGAGTVKAKQNQVTLYTTQQNMYRTQIQQNTVRVDQLQKIQQQQENRLDSLLQRGRGTGVQQQVVRENARQINQLQQEILAANKKVDSLEMEKTNTTNSIASEGKIGTFTYVADVIGVPLDTIIKWFILLLVLVFDPLSVSLFLAYNVATNKKVQIDVAPTNEPSVEPEQIKIEEVKPPQSSLSSTPYYMESNYDWKNDERWRTDHNAIEYKGKLGMDPLKS